LNEKLNLELWLKDNVYKIGSCDSLLNNVSAFYNRLISDKFRFTNLLKLSLQTLEKLFPDKSNDYNSGIFYFYNDLISFILLFLNYNICKDENFITGKNYIWL